MPEYRTDVDIANRALQHVGASRIVSLTDDSKNAAECQFAYGKIREAEMRRNAWTCAIRRAYLRPADANTMLLDVPLWAPTTTYFVGSIVADQYGNLWVSRIRSNLANDPLLTYQFWEPYFGPLSVSLYASGTSYELGELVYTAVGDGTNRVYMSVASANTDNPATATAYSATTTYFKNQVVTSASIAYMSLTDLNKGNTPASSPSQWTTSFVGGAGSMKWLQIGGAEFPFGVGLTVLPIIYPIAFGPGYQGTARNIYKLPNGFLRQATQYPNAAPSSFLGGPTGIQYSTWVYENGFLLTPDAQPIALRFVANLTDVRSMDPMFCEALATRLALTVCEELTQSTAKLGAIARLYQEFVEEARTVNAIEQGTELSPDDDWVTVRL